MQIAKLQLRRGAEFFPTVKTVLDEHKAEVEGLVGAEPVVHASYYRVACDYFSALGPADKFYKNALMFLAYTQYDELPADERFDLAVNISIAALTGDGVFNFGEVVRLTRCRVLRIAETSLLICCSSSRRLSCVLLRARTSSGFPTCCTCSTRATLTSLTKSSVPTALSSTLR